MLPDSLQNAPVVFKGVRFDVLAVELTRRSGGVMRREIVRPPDSVVVLPVFDNGDIVLIRNDRFAVGRTLWEVCAGTLEPGEAPAVCAARELIEETGYEAAALTPLTSFYPTPGFCTEFMHGYLARGLNHVGQNLDDTEQITPEVLPMTTALAMIRRGEIIDAKTIAMLLYVHTFAAELR
jgi:ADP-ribose pyrophosphatase